MAPLSAATWPGPDPGSVPSWDPGSNPVRPELQWPARDADHLLVTGRQMGELEAQLFASGLPVEALMEKAALAVASRLQPDVRAAGGALVLVGPGHNGGDGLVVARELGLAGLPVRIWSPFERHKPFEKRPPLLVDRRPVLRNPAEHD